MRNIWLGIALVPYLAVAGVDFWMHERDRQVPRAEQWLHAALALSMGAFLVSVFAGRGAFAAAALAAFLPLLAFDELVFHRAIAAAEKRVHALGWVGLAGFVLAWLWIDFA